MNQKTPLVSVLMLTYNHEPYIAQAIESVLMQKTDFPYELIIGEDCSTDGTRAIVEKYANANPEIIRILSGPANIGALANIERINAASRGKYLATLEGDDFWNDELKLQKQVDFLESNPEYGLVHSDVNHWYEESGTLIKNYNAINHFHIPEGNIYNELLDPDQYIVKTPSALFRKDLHDRHVDYEIVRSNGWAIADLFNWLSMARFTKFKYFPQAMATYRVLVNSAGNTEDYKKKARIHKSVYGIRFYFIGKYPDTEWLLDKINKRFVSTMLFDAFKMPDKKLSSEIRAFANNNKVKLHGKEYLLYWGAQNIMIRKLLAWGMEIFGALKRRRRIGLGGSNLGKS